MANKQQINIYCITNTDNRNQQFIPIFEQLQHHCKLIKDRYCIVDSRISVNNTLFDAILRNCGMKGYQYTMFDLNQKEENDKTS